MQKLKQYYIFHLRQNSQTHPNNCWKNHQIMKQEANYQIDDNLEL